MANQLLGRLRKTFGRQCFGKQCFGKQCFGTGTLLLPDCDCNIASLGGSMLSALCGL